jgi:hypothetical protein
MIFEKLFGKQPKEIINQVKKQGYAVERPNGDSSDQPIAAFRGKVAVGNRSFPCDTALSVNNADVPGGGRAEFSTFIWGGRQGKNLEHLNRVIDNYNCHLPGKLVRDYTDDSYDIMYVTSEPQSKLDTHLVVENVHHHAQMKARLMPEFEHLDNKLNLHPRTSLSPSERYGKNHMRSNLELPSIPDITYTPDHNSIKSKSSY